MRTSKRIRGMSLVELMVGMAVGLIGITIITHLYVTNEKYKRSTTGAGQAQVNGAIALYTLERDLRMAGAGLNHSGALGCTCAGAGCSQLQYVRNGVFSSPPGGGGVPALQFAPLVITETANQPDTITVLYGTSPFRMLPVKLINKQDTPISVLQPDGNDGFVANDMIVLANGTTCRMAQVSSVSGATVLHDTGTWNGGAPFAAMPEGALVFNLGANPAWRIYSVANGKLRVSEVLTNHVTGGTPTEIMDDIVDLQAQYGKDLVAPVGAVDAWDTTLPVDAAAWQQVLAVRVAVLARSQNYERPDPATGQCSSTIWDANRPQWGEGQDFPVLAAVATGLQNTASEMRCYKYRVFETIIPLRNMIWRPA